MPVLQREEKYLAGGGTSMARYVYNPDQSRERFHYTIFSFSFFFSWKVFSLCMHSLVLVIVLIGTSLPQSPLVVASLKMLHAVGGTHCYWPQPQPSLSRRTEMRNSFVRIVIHEIIIQSKIMHAMCFMFYVQYVPMQIRAAQECVPWFSVLALTADCENLHPKRSLALVSIQFTQPL